jgi:hypothetical protein
MRLVLVDAGSDRVCGDSAVFAARSAEWAENAFRDARIEDMSLIAARLLDERAGKLGWRYRFDPLGPVDDSSYDVFVVNEDAESLPQLFDENSFPSLVTRSQFAGHVRRSPPAKRGGEAAALPRASMRLRELA